MKPKHLLWTIIPLLSLPVAAQDAPSFGQNYALSGGGSGPQPIANQMCEAKGNYSANALTVTFGTCLGPNGNATANVMPDDSFGIFVNTNVGITSLDCDGVAAIPAGSPVGGISAYFVSGSAGGAVTCTLNLASPYGVYELVVQEFQPATLDPAAYGSFTSEGSWNPQEVTSSFTTGVANETIFAYCKQNNGIQSAVGTSPLAFTQLASYPPGAELLEYASAPSAGSTQASCSGLGNWVGAAIVAMGIQPISTGYYVSSSGSDSNPGTQAQPLKTIAGWKTAYAAAPRSALYLAAGQTFNAGSTAAPISSRIDTPQDGFTVASFGAGAQPILSAWQVLSPGCWSATLGFSDVWQCTVTTDNPSSGGDWVNCRMDGVMKFQATYLASLTGSAGLCYIPANGTQTATTQTIYVQAANSPTTNGHLYEATVSNWGIGGTAAGLTVTNIETDGNMSQSGSIVTGQNATLNNVKAINGSKHNLFTQQGCIVNTASLTSHYFGGTPNTLFILNDNSPAGGNCTLNNVTATEAVDSTNAEAFYSHVNVGGLYGTITCNNCVARAGAGGLEFVGVNTVVVNGGSIQGPVASAAATDIYQGGLTLSGAGYIDTSFGVNLIDHINCGSSTPAIPTGCVYYNGSGGTLSITNSDFTGSAEPIFINHELASFTGTGNRFPTTGSATSTWQAPPVSMTFDNNCYVWATSFFNLWGGNYYAMQAPAGGTSRATWQALGFDVHSTFGGC